MRHAMLRRRFAAPILSLFVTLLPVWLGTASPAAASPVPATQVGPPSLAQRSARPSRQDAPDAAITVCPAGCDHATIQAALDRAQTGDAIFVGSGTYTEQLVVNTSIELRGVDPSVTLIDGGGAGPVLHIKRGVGVTIAGFTITGGRADSGAGIYNEGSAFVTNCVVEGNATGNPDTGYGGGIFNYGGTMTLTDVVVRDNEAELGGGVLNSYGGMTIARGAITGNRARQFGAGIFNGYTARLGVDTVDLSDNVVEGGPTPRGGGIYNTGFVNIGRSTLSGNRSGENGGAIYQYVDTTILSNSTMSGNVADFGGSGMYINAGSGLMTNVTVADNSGGFGAIFSNDVIQLRNSLVGNNAPSSCFGTVTSAGHNLDSGNTCSFDEVGDMTNTNPRTLPMGEYGGLTRTIALTAASPAIDAGDPEGCTAPDDTLLTTDQRGQPRPVDGKGDGRSICDIGSFEYFDERVSATPTAQRPDPVAGELTVCENGCDHSRIQAAVDAARSGATIAIQAGTYVENVVIDGKALTLAGAGAPFSVIDGNRKGPVLTIRGAVAVTVRGLSLTRGAGVYAPDADLTLRSSRISFNSDPRAGGVYTAARLTVEDCDIDSNVSLTRGGGILVDEGGIAVVRRSRLSANTSAVDGGGIYAAGSLTVEDSVITGNGGRYGGGISARGAAVNLSNSSFVGNRAEYGAGVFLLGGSLTMQGGTVQGNRADVAGGVYVGSSDTVPGTGSLTDVAIIENIAEGDYGTGGGLISNGARVTIQGGRLRENRGNFGGALYFYRDGADLQVRGVELALNSANFGGAVYGRSGQATLTDCTVQQNTATLDGGAIHADGASVTVVGGRVGPNSAVRDGGAAHTGDNGSVRFERVTLAGNAAGRHGGGLRVENVATLSEVTLERNQVEGGDSQGGALSVAVGGSASIERSLLASNSALQGGALAISGTLRLENSTLTDNQALFGGAIYSGGGDVALASVTLAHNRVVANEGETGGAAGIQRVGAAGRVELRDSIVALNANGADCLGQITSAGYNLDGDNSCGLRSSGDRPDQDPGLSELQANGGASRTMALLTGSPAVDAGDPSGCRGADGAAVLETDQRGIARSVDGDGDGTPRCDIGAFELRIRESQPTVYLPMLRRGE
ncbi:MAG: hypothetical protein H6648_00940 [Caldilineae bacterium]|nr:hypothetical protein [Caldilineae bacterium]